MSYATDAKKAVTQAYVDAALGYNTAYPNTFFIYPSSGVWVEFKPILNRVTPFALGRSRVTGILQLDVKGHIDEGPAAVLAAVDAIATAFDIGNKWTDNTVDYIVNGFDHTEPVIDDENQFVTFLRISYEAIR